METRLELSTPHNFLDSFCLFQGAVKIMAKDLIRTRHQIEKFYKLKSQLQGVALRIQVLYANLSPKLMLPLIFHFHESKYNYC